MRKVVITGMGAVTPIGNNVADMWDSMIHGRHGIDEITHFDTSDIPIKLAAEVKGYDASEYMSRKDMNRYDPYTVFGIGAASQAADSLDLCQYFGQKKLKYYADFFSSSSSLCCGVI